MADIADMAHQFESQRLAEALAARRQAVQVQPTGFCHNPVCGDDVDDGQLYCDRRCALQHERIDKR